MADEPWAIGKRRWRVWIGRRDQTPKSGAAGIDETLIEIERVWANIMPIGAMTFYAATQTDVPVTHRIWTRWLDYVDTRHIVLRRSTRTDGSVREEHFRVRRVVEDQGRKRYTMIEAMLEEVK